MPPRWVLENRQGFNWISSSGTSVRVHLFNLLFVFLAPIESLPDGWFFYGQALVSPPATAHHHHHPTSFLSHCRPLKGKRWIDKLMDGSPKCCMLRQRLLSVFLFFPLFSPIFPLYIWCIIIPEKFATAITTRIAWLSVLLAIENRVWVRLSWVDCQCFPITWCVFFVQFSWITLGFLLVLHYPLAAAAVFCHVISTH